MDVRNRAQLRALEKQRRLEQRQRVKAQQRGEIRLEDLPADMRSDVHTCQMALLIAGLIRRGVFEHDRHDHVQGAVQYLESMAAFHDARVRAHPDFAKVFPDAAAQQSRDAAQRRGALVGLDGQPLESALDTPQERLEQSAAEIAEEVRAEVVGEREPTHGVDCSYGESCTVGQAPGLAPDECSGDTED